MKQGMHSTDFGRNRAGTWAHSRQPGRSPGITLTHHCLPVVVVAGRQVGGDRGSYRPLRVPRKIPQLFKRSLPGSAEERRLSWREMWTRGRARRPIQTILAVRGAEDINYYLVVPPFVTLNLTELLPHHRKVSQCHEPCAQPPEHERVHEHNPQLVWNSLQPVLVLTPASATHPDLCPVTMQVQAHVFREQRRQLQQSFRWAVPFVDPTPLQHLHIVMLTALACVCLAGQSYASSST